MGPERLAKNLPETKKKGYGNIITISLLAVLLLGALLYLKKDALNLHFGSSSNIPSDGSVADKELPAYIEFARNVDISLCNFGFTNLQSYLQVNSGYFTQDLLNDFQSNFFTDDLQKKIVAQKIYCTEENITAQQTKVKGNQVGVWFTGTLVYASMGTNPVSKIQIPYSHRLIVQKLPEGFKVVSFEFVNTQKEQTF